MDQYGSYGMIVLIDPSKRMMIDNCRTVYYRKNRGRETMSIVVVENAEAYVK
jgi:hypothetical protein